MSRMAVERIPDEAILMPSVYYAFNVHHLDFPGTIAVEGGHVHQLRHRHRQSLAHHGFRKILLVNGHGSNVPFLDIAARNITNQTQAICAMVPWWNLVPKKLMKELRESEYPGAWRTAANWKPPCCSTCAATWCSSRKASRDINFQSTEYFYWDLGSAVAVFFQEWFQRYSKTGHGGRSDKGHAREGSKVRGGGLRSAWSRC